jgi:hypothetical protein
LLNALVVDWIEVVAEVARRVGVMVIAGSFVRLIVVVVDLVGERLVG